MDKEIEAISQARLTFQDSTDMMTYYAGNIESGRQAQILQDDTFDLIIMIDDLNTADEIDHLLKCLHDRGSLILKRSKQQFPDFDSIEHIRALSDVSILNWFSDENYYAARKIHQTPVAKGDTIFIIKPQESLTELVELSHQLSTRLTSQGFQVEAVQWASENASNLHGKSLIFLLELDTPFLSDLSEEDYSLLKKIALNSSRLLWVSRGTDPAMQTTIGYLRVLQNENASDDNQQGGSTESVTLRDLGDSALILHHNSNKQTKSFWLTVEESQQSDLAEDEVEVQVKAIGIK
ncbi:hypothetical protein F66182_16817 [Fusarium sp. NRRL 66182]|nr:hypothetical protein F66182_16817 [Fusarium sp. NRRL 66182]